MTLTLRIKFRKKHEAVDVAPVICWSFFKGLKVCNGVAFLLLTEEPRMRRDIAGSLEHGGYRVSNYLSLASGPRAD